MPTTPEAAYDTITTRFEADWNTLCVGWNGLAPVPAIRWYGSETGDIPKLAFCRFKMQNVLERQRTFRNGDEVEGNARYVTAGIIFVQVFTPRNNNVKALEQCRKLATIARNIFRGKTFDGCILFRNVRVVDIDDREIKDNYVQKNVVMEFEYDEIS